MKGSSQGRQRNRSVVPRHRRRKPRDLSKSAYAFLVPIKIFRTKVAFVVGKRPDLKDWARVARRFDIWDGKDRDLKGPHNHDGHALCAHFPRGHMVYLPAPAFDPDWFDSTAHEMIHIVAAVLSDCDVAINERNSETAAYLAGWLTGEVMHRMIPYLRRARRSAS